MLRWRKLCKHLAAAITLSLVAPRAVAEPTSPLFETHGIHDSYPTGLKVVDLNDQRWLVTVAWDGWLKLWDAETGKSGPAVRLTERRLNCLVVATFGVAIVGSDDGLFVYDLTAHRALAHLLPGVALHHVTVHPSLPVAYAADSAGKVYAFDLTAQQVVTSWSTLGRTLTFFGVTQDGETLITADSQKVRLWSTATGNLLKAYEPLGPNEPIAAVVYPTSGDLLYLGSGSRVTAIDLASGQNLAALTVSTAPLVGLAAGATPGELLVASGDGEVKLWDFDLGCATVELASIGDKGYSHWAFSADHRRVFALMSIVNWLKGWNLDGAADACMRSITDL